MYNIIAAMQQNKKKQNLKSFALRSSEHNAQSMYPGVYVCACVCVSLERWGIYLNGTLTGQHSAATECVSTQRESPSTPPLCFLLLTPTSLPLSLARDPAHCYCFPLQGQS